MTMTDGRSALAESLAKAQGEMENAPLNRVNPHFKSKYADLAAIRDATIPALSKNGLSIFQYTEIRDGALVLRTRLMHASGQYIESEYPIAAQLGDHHKTGSALTYAKRYSWSAMCGISADDDDDGNAAQDGNRKKSGEAFGGPLNKTDLKAKMRTFAADLAACEDGDTLAGLLHSYGEVLAQCARDLPDWWEGTDDQPGAAQRINQKQTELAQNKEIA